MQDQNIGKYIFGGIVGLLALIVVLGSFGTVGAGERGIKTRFGAVVGTVPQGLYFKLPLFESVKKMSVRTEAVLYERENPLLSASEDLQDVKISTVVNYHIDPTAVETIYVKYGSSDGFEETVVRPAVRDVVKATASQFTAEELVTKRAEFTTAVLSKLNERLVSANVVVEGVNITNFEFSPSFTQAIEAKVTAVQNAEAAKNKLEQIKFEAEQTVTTAKAVAEAQRIQSQALESSGGKSLVDLEIVKKWDGQGCTSNCYGSASQSPIPFINLNK